MSSVPDPIAYGPTWERDDEGQFVLPDHTLGWQVLGWTAKWLRQPDGPDAGRPWKATPEQARFLLWWFAIDQRGRWLYPYGVLRRVKGWGKDPLAAVIAAVEFAGPCRFAGWDDGGEPVAVPHPAAWVQVGAVSREQTRVTMTLFPSLLSEALVDDQQVDLGKEIIYADRGRRRLEAVTSSPRSLEGSRATFVVANETQHWLTANEGHAMAAVIDRNAIKSRDGSSRALALTNAHAPGEDSVAERDWDAFLKLAQSKGQGWLYDSLEAPADTDLSDEDSLRAGICAARGDSYWLDEDRTVQAVWDPRTPPSTSRRFYLNQLAAAEDAWVAPHEWDACQADDALEPGDEVTLGFDGSRTDDWTALIACRMSDGLVQLLDCWDPAKHGGEAPREAIDAAVAHAHETYQVAAFFSDVHPWESYVDQWGREFGDRYRAKPHRDHACGFDMRTRTADFTRAAEKAELEIVDGTLTYATSPVLSQHVKNARRRPNRHGVGFGKEHRESSRKVDAAVAMVLARLARDQVLRGGKSSKKPSTRMVGV